MRRSYLKYRTSINAKISFKQYRSLMTQSNSNGPVKSSFFVKQSYYSMIDNKSNPILSITLFCWERVDKWRGHKPLQFSKLQSYNVCTTNVSPFWSTMRYKEEENDVWWRFTKSWAHTFRLRVSLLRFELHGLRILHETTSYQIINWHYRCYLTFSLESLSERIIHYIMAELSCIYS